MFLNAVIHKIFLQLGRQHRSKVLGNVMLIEAARKDSQSICTYFTRDSSCVGSDIEIDSWKMNMQCNVT